MSDQAESHNISQTYIYAGSLLLSFLLEGIMQVIFLIGILTFGPLELYQLCRRKV